MISKLMSDMIKAGFTIRVDKCNDCNGIKAIVVRLDGNTVAGTDACFSHKQFEDHFEDFLTEVSSEIIKIQDDNR